MAATFYYLEAPHDDEILRWFRSLPDPPCEVRSADFTAFHFANCGDLTFEDGTRRIDGAQSPVVTVFEPRVQRRVLWTVGEVHFLTKHIRSRFPELAKIQKRFSAWLDTNPIVWNQREDQGASSGYFLEGQIKNIAEKVYALPSGLSAYDAGRYFVLNQESEFVLGRICQRLRLRGVECDEADDR